MAMEAEETAAPARESGMQMEGPIPFLYTNGMNVTFGPFDFWFSVNMTPPGAGRTPVGQVAMSAQHAKLLSELLTQKVAEYEASFGPLYSREEMEERVRAHNEKQRTVKDASVPPRPS